MPETVRVELGDRSYDVVVGRGILEQAALFVPDDAMRAVIVTQPPVADRYASMVRDAIAEAGTEVDVVVVPDGEAAKDLSRGPLRRTRPSGGRAR